MIRRLVAKERDTRAERHRIDKLQRNCFAVVERPLSTSPDNGMNAQPDFVDEAMPHEVARQLAVELGFSPRARMGLDIGPAEEPARPPGR